ncbi:nop seven associated protein 1 [Holotrichia oblita]|uniref:Nop seven associated protein 1 n=1 Tax=Holotrichia oblita TaxID=644536 RepID=A0ACB9TL77_HOLOL|nr:nop seven associated protein 1 [Holotrichia oblita]
MSFCNKYCIYFGTVRGVIGNTSCEPNKPAKYELFNENETAGITCMEWGRTQDEIVVGQSNGCLNLYDTLTSKVTVSIPEIDGKGAVVGAGIIEDDILVARKSGHLVIWNSNIKECITTNLCGDSTLECIAHSKSQPILPSCCTKEGHVLLYDERVQRKPVCKFIEPKASYTAITSTFKEKQCLVGTTKGYMQLLDLKIPTKCLKTFKTFTGSVSSIVCDPVSSIVATVSLDRHLRIHNIDTKELLYKEYVKQSLTKILLKPIIKEETNELDQNHKDIVVDEQLKSNPIEEDDEYDKMFEKMETIKEARKSTNKLKRKKDL